MGGVWTAIARCAVPTYFAISGYFNKKAGKKQLEKGINFLRIFLVLNLVWFGIYTLISYSPYKELARWAKLDVNSKNILKCLLFGSAFGNEYLWYLHAIGMVYVVVYFAAKSQLDKIIHRCFPCLVILYWIMSEGTLLAFGKSVQPFMYRNWLVEGVGFYYVGKWIRKHECQRRTLSIGMLIIGSIVTTVEYRICGRLEFYFGNLLMVYGMLALGKPESLITHVGDRKGHDMRYAIDPTKIHNELGWLPETKFEDGIKKTIQWYLDNREWWETIISGEYQNYYEKMYSNR